MDTESDGTHGFSKSILIRKSGTLRLLVLGLADLVVAWGGGCFGSLTEAAGTATLAFAQSGVCKEGAGLRVSRRSLICDVDGL